MPVFVLFPLPLPPLANNSVRDLFLIPKIIFNLTLVLSPYTFLLGMLFCIGAFKLLRINYLENLYSLRVLKGLNKQKLPLKDELLDKYVFCQAVYKYNGIWITLK
jgi:hypothetical protein